MPPDLMHVVDISWNRICYFHVGRRHAYTLPAINENGRRPQQSSIALPRLPMTALRNSAPTGELLDR